VGEPDERALQTLSQDRGQGGQTGREDILLKRAFDPNFLSS